MFSNSRRSRWLASFRPMTHPRKAVENSSIAEPGTAGALGAAGTIADGVRSYGRANRRADNRSRLSAATPSLSATPWLSLAQLRRRLRARRRAECGQGQTADNAERYSPYARPTRRAHNRSRLSAATPSLSATPWLSLARLRWRLRARHRAECGQGQTADNAERYSPYARPTRRADNRSRLSAATPFLSATPWLSLAQLRRRLRARRRAECGQGQTADNAERYSPYARPTRRANNRSRLSAATPSLSATPWLSLAQLQRRLRARRRAECGQGQTADNAERYSPYARPTRRANNRSRLSAASPSLSATPWLSLAQLRRRLRARYRAECGQGQTADNAERYSPYARSTRRAHNRSRLSAVGRASGASGVAGGNRGRWPVAAMGPRPGGPAG